MQSIPLTILSFFCLSLLYFITFCSSLSLICKFANFMSEARIAKIFYISLMILCMVRACCFGVSTFIFVDKYGEASDGAMRNLTISINHTTTGGSFNHTGHQDNKLDIDDFQRTSEQIVKGQSIYSINDSAINSISKSLVLLMLSPDYLFNFAYLNLIWQLYSFFFDGFAQSMFNLFCEGMGEKNIIFFSFTLFASQVVLTCLYVLNLLEADKLVLAITVINFVLPSLAVIGLIHLQCKFSGIPKKSEYKQRIKKL